MGWTELLLGPGHHGLPGRPGPSWAASARLALTAPQSPAGLGVGSMQKPRCPGSGPTRHRPTCQLLARASTGTPFDGRLYPVPHASPVAEGGLASGPRRADCRRTQAELPPLLLLARNRHFGQGGLCAKIGTETSPRLPARAKTAQNTEPLWAYVTYRVLCRTQKKISVVRSFSLAGEGHGVDTHNRPICPVGH